MKKQDFIRLVAEKAGVSIATATTILDTQVSTIYDELNAGNEVNITGFGSFKVSHRAARNGVNPKTWAALKIPAMKSPVFKAGKGLKDSLR